MALVDALVTELDRELAVTRVLLERTPDDRLSWRPHHKSFTLGQLASHVANLPRWGAMTLAEDGLDLEGGTPPREASSRETLLSDFDEQASAFREALVGRSDAELMAGWTLRQKGKVLFTMPKVSVLRSFVMNHLIHHRGQLTVYLRQLDVPLPSIYGPSADEGQF